ncbi:FGGY-family carbohydrate kinase [Lacticaseibacillus suilingensis]|uniref:FGGY-family carbohydrate kinase n=1 Tax=Lacticaseibacillus suilingensis TaxID=2799577 RepID=A0ABW4BDR6_9LACO|nr:FGGY-family carbohydrate kinase [Lacticaseibacillus suilingensis]
MEKAIKQAIQSGRLVLGLELGSTRIKAELLTDQLTPVATGAYGWTNDYQNGNWTYSLAQVWRGIQAAYQALATAVKTQYDCQLEQIGAIGISAMMHGYLVFDDEDQLLTPFRTWRNNTTAAASAALSELFGFNIPQRWSVAHLYQAILNGEPVTRINTMTTLAGYVHWQLSGQKVVGVGDAAGMFPIDSATGQYDATKLALFDALPAVQAQGLHLEPLLPTPLKAGTVAGYLTPAGARLLDPSGVLQAGALMAPPEGDAGTGMVATNSVAVNSGNISVGTSAFAMVVLPAVPNHWDPAIDIVATPTGQPVAMIHANNCSSDLNAWVTLLGDAITAATGMAPSDLYPKFLGTVPEADADLGGLLAFANLSGENLTHVEQGRPLQVRTPSSRLTLPNFMATQLFAAFAPLAIGMAQLQQEVSLKQTAMVAQGGLFQTPKIAQQVLADALGMPITVMTNADVGGPFGMAVLALFALQGGGDLAAFLKARVFQAATGITLTPAAKGQAAYQQFLMRYQQALPLARQAGNLVD